MGGSARILTLALATATACGGAAASGSGAGEPTAGDVHARIVRDFERATLAGEPRYAELFDFAAVGKLEKLLHRYDLRGRSELTPAQREQFGNEDAKPFSPERERRNLGHHFFPPLAQRTVGTGGCREVDVVDPYARALGQPFEPLTNPADAAYEGLRSEVNALVAKGGILGIACTGGQGRLAIVYTTTNSTRGYDLITLYDDVGP